MDISLVRGHRALSTGAWGQAVHGHTTIMLNDELDRDTFEIIDLGELDTAYHMHSAEGVRWAIGPQNAMAFGGAIGPVLHSSL